MSKDGMTGASPATGEVQLVVPNFKKRLSGVTSTIVNLVPLNAKKIGTATLGPGLPADFPALRWWQVPGLLRKPKDGKPRVWHARRNVEMLGGVVLRYVFRAPMKLLFTSAAQREHSSWTRFLVRRMDAVVATSGRAAAYLKVPNTVIMHGIDVDRFRPPADRADAVRQVGLDPDRYYAGCFGRIRPQKGTDVFVEAMIELLPQFPKWSAVITGRVTGPYVAYEADLRARVAAAGLSDRILFAGETPDIQPWFAAMTLFVAPQRWEGFGLTPLEAMASGVPVVATDVGAFSELIANGETGVIVPPDEVQTITDAIRLYFADPAMANQQGRAGRKRVEANFRLQGEAEKLLGVYEKLRAEA